MMKEQPIASAREILGGMIEDELCDQLDAEIVAVSRLLRGLLEAKLSVADKQVLLSNLPGPVTQMTALAAGAISNVVLVLQELKGAGLLDENGTKIADSLAVIRPVLKDAVKKKIGCVRSL